MVRYKLLHLGFRIIRGDTKLQFSQDKNTCICQLALHLPLVPVLGVRELPLIYYRLIHSSTYARNRTTVSL